MCVRARRAQFKGAANAAPFFSLDSIPKDVVPNAQIIATPRDDSGPGQMPKEGPAWAGPSGPRDPPRDDPCERSQEVLKVFPAASPDDEVQVAADVREVVDTNVEPARDIT